MSILFLTLPEILKIHNDQIKRYGGEAGVRDLNLLKSAAATPAVSFSGEYLHSDIIEMAAAYLFHFVKNHPFIDGNKRTAVVCAMVFLALNDVKISIPEEKLFNAVHGVISAQITKSGLAEIFRNHINVE